jgi:hypothetical protein
MFVGLTAGATVPGFPSEHKIGGAFEEEYNRVNRVMDDPTRYYCVRERLQ